MSNDAIQTQSRQYEPPVLEVLGSVHVLTLTNKTFGLSDGDWYVGNGSPQGLANAS